MQSMFQTLHAFMLHTKEITYLIMGGLLIAFLLFWLFLSGRDEEESQL